MFLSREVSVSSFCTTPFNWLSSEYRQQHLHRLCCTRSCHMTGVVRSRMIPSPARLRVRTYTHARTRAYTHAHSRACSVRKSFLLSQGRRTRGGSGRPTFSAFFFVGSLRQRKRTKIDVTIHSSHSECL